MYSDVKKYMIRLEPQIITRLAFAVLVSDEFAPYKSPIGSTKVMIKNRNYEATKNLSGYHIFINLPNGDYTIQIKSDYYADQEVDIAIPRKFTGSYILNHKANIGDKEAVLADVVDLMNGDILEFSNGNGHTERRWITLHQDPSIAKIYWDKDIRGGLDHAYEAGTALRVPPSQIRQQERSFRIDLKPNSYYPFPPGATLIRGVLHDENGKAVSGATVKIEKITIGDEQPTTPLERIGEDIQTTSSESGDFAIYFAKFKFERNNITIAENYKMIIDLKITHQDFQDFTLNDLNVPNEKTTTIGIVKMQK